MAKKRKLAQNNSTPTSEPEPEPQSQPEPEPEPEPIEEEQPPINEEEPEVGEEEDDGDEIEEPKTLENPNPTPDPAASNGVGGGDEEEDSDPESLQKILELFPKDQLVDLIRDAAGRHVDVRREVHRLADVDPVLRKIFVHGLGWDTSAKVLTDVFSQYGEIEDCNAVTDKVTGKSKGYAFILFKHRKGAQSALREPQKKIGNRMTACQLASAGPGPQQAAPPPAAPPLSEYTQRKIFVSNVGADIDPHKLFEFFAKFGEVEEGPLGLDKATGKPRGFCLFVYKTVESARKALEEPHKNFEGHVLHCQKAIDGPKNKPGFQFQFQFQHQHGAGAQYPGGGPKGNFSSGVGSHMPAAAGGHLMAPPTTGLGYQAAAALAGGAGQPMASVAGLNPAVNQALTALLLGGLGPAVNQGVPGQMGNTGTQGGYGSGLGGYGGQAQVQGGYGGAEMGQGGGVYGQQGYGHAGGGPPYMGHH